MKTYLLGFLLLAPGLSRAQTTYPFLVKGRVGQLSAPAKIYLMNGQLTVDSVTLRKGRFELKGTTPMPHTATLVLERQGRLQSGLRERMLGGKMRRAYIESPDRIRLFLEPGPVVVTSADSLRTAHVAGGPLTADYQRLQTAEKPAVDKLQTANSQAQFDDARVVYAQSVMAFITANPASWVSLEALLQLKTMAVPQYATVAPVYAALSPTLRESPAGRQYDEMLDGLKAVAVGAQAPNFTQQTPEGETVSLADYRGKYVLVDFWASWCAPCRAENPAVLKAYNAFKGRNFEVLGVSLDEEKSRGKWVQAIADDHMPWTQISDLRGWKSEAAQRYGVQAIPQNFLIDPTGKIVAANLRGDNLEATLAQLIK